MHAETTGRATFPERIYVINLATRPDRLREMRGELARLGLGPEDALVKIFAGIRPEEPGAFPSIGARGCFLSQLGVLRDARDRGYRAILLLEDDAAFTARYVAEHAAILAELEEKTDWAMAYLGHRITAGPVPDTPQGPAGHWRALPPETTVECAHAVLFHARAIALLVPYLERMMARPAGHAEGGAMHVDGAYNWFRRDHPELPSLVTPVQYVTQRASKSDIALPSWKDRLPFVGVFRGLKNRLVRGRG